MAAYKNVSFDDRDTDHLKYGGGWFLTGSWNATHVGETGTLASANNLSANVTFTFPMPATAFYYYGIPRCCGGLYAICIDCDPEKPQFVNIDAVNITDDGQNPPVVLYAVHFDQPAVHEIIIANQFDPRFNKSQITIDRFDLEVVDENAVAGTTTSSSLAGFSTQVPANQPTAVGASSSSSSSNVPAIIGGCFGAFILIVSLILLFIWLARRRSRRAPWQETQPSSYPGQFNYAPRVPSEYGPEYPRSEMRQSFTTITSGNFATPLRHGHSVSPSMATSVNPFTVTRHTDAGRVQEDSNVGSLPPEYEQVFSREQSQSGFYSENSGSSSSRSRYPSGKS